MRILHLVHQYPPEFMGGTELYTQMLAWAQVENGHQVSLFYPSSSIGDSLTLEVEQGVRVYRLPLGPRSRTQVFMDTLWRQDLTLSFARILEQEKPDLVHIQHLMGMPFNLADQLQKAGIPYVVTLHDYWYLCANAQLITNTDETVCPGPDRRFINCGQCALARAGKDGVTWAAPLIAPMMGYRSRRLRKVLDGARKVIAPTDFVHQIYRDLGTASENIVVIRHGIDLPDNLIGKKGEEIDDLSSDRPLRVGYVGSIGWQKGVHVLIDAANQLPVEDVELVIYGDLNSFPEYAGQLAEAIKRPNISLAGAVSREELWEALDKLDLVVLPMLWYETSSLVLDEAFAASVPVLASDIGVLADKVTDGVNGRLFPTGDAGALASILEETAAHRDLLDQWRSGIPPVRTIKDHVREIEALYHSTLDTV